MTSQRPISDETLVLSAQKGDLEAFTMLYERYLTTVYNRVRYLVPAEDVEDVTQDVFIAVMKSLSSFRWESKFSTWLRTLTNRRIADYYRSRKPAEDQLQIDPGQLHQSLVVQHDQKQREEVITLCQAFVGLPEDYREVLFLRFVDGLKFNEIAESVSISLEAAKSRYRRAVATLRERMTNVKA
jgi:RNA polymerase sigma-70 factor (ECF subfamily)